MKKKCKVCKKITTVAKDGHSNNKQRYMCKSCNHVFVEGDSRRGRIMKFDKNILKIISAEFNEINKLQTNPQYRSKSKKYSSKSYSPYSYTNMRKELRKKLKEFFKNDFKEEIVPSISYLSWLIMYSEPITIPPVINLNRLINRK